MSDNAPQKPVRRPFKVDWAFLVVAGLSLASAITVYRREGWEATLEIFRDDSWLFATILPKVAAGCLIGALFRLLVPSELVRKLVGEGSGWKGLLIATLIGALLPGGPFTVFPLAAVFMVSGADRGSTIAFVSAWLLLGVNRAIIWEVPFFGTGFVGLRVLVSLFMPVLAGGMVRLIDARHGGARR